MPTHKEIADLLQKNLFLSSQGSQRILKMSMEASPEVLPLLRSVLQDALKKQEEYIQKMVKADPSFAQRVQQFLSHQLSSIHGEWEEREQENVHHLEDLLSP